jgi:hypothetical protein
MGHFVNHWSRRTWRIVTTLAIAIALAGWALYSDWRVQQQLAQAPPPPVGSELASRVLATLPVKGRAPLTGYSRKQFGSGWADTGGCDMRERILARDMTSVRLRSATDCTVLRGVLDDPYTGKIIGFTRGPSTSSQVQIDHVVALGDAWQKGAQQLPLPTREHMYNDPLELLAVDGPANQQKGDGDAATWLPSNKSYRCRYVARQIAVKRKYHLWVTMAEHDAMQRILATCPTQVLPIGPST